MLNKKHNIFKNVIDYYKRKEIFTKLIEKLNQDHL